MFVVTTVYAFDIETDTTIDGRDPSLAAIVSIALAGEHMEAGLASLAPSLRSVVLHVDPDGTQTAVWMLEDFVSEQALLQSFDGLLELLPPGLLASWNGSAFDLPFIQTRAALTDTRLGAVLVPDPARHPKYDPLAGHAGCYRATWYGHRHVDVAYSLQPLAARLGVAWSLKPVATALGFTPVEVDRARIHELTRAEVIAYNASDAVVTRELAFQVEDLEASADAL